MFQEADKEEAVDFDRRLPLPLRQAISTFDVDDRRVAIP
jgi:hypothetical protein